MIEQTRVIDEAVQDTAVPTVPYDITSFGADYEVEGLVNKLDRGDIIIPPFQRYYVWSQAEASRFIESLLLGLPVPGIFLAREQDTNRFLVIDGQQRLKSLQFFVHGQFNPNPDAKSIRVFDLTKVQKRFEGLTFDALLEPDQRKLLYSIIHATIIKQDAPQDNDTSIYHIFERLNTSGRKLTPHQIRVAVYYGDFIDMIKSLNSYQNWRKVFGPINPTLKDQELILRFLALYFDGENYVRPINEFLNKFAKRRRNPGPTFLATCEELFTSTIDIVNIALGRRAFRPERAVNAAVFDSVMVGLARRLKKDPAIEQKGFLDAYSGLLRDKTYLELTSQSTSDEKNVQSRIDIATKYFADV